MTGESGLYDQRLVQSLGGFYPLGIMPTDDQETVRRKIGVSPSKAFVRMMAGGEIWREEYELQTVDRI